MLLCFILLRSNQTDIAFCIINMLVLSMVNNVDTDNFFADVVKSFQPNIHYRKWYIFQLFPNAIVAKLLLCAHKIIDLNQNTWWFSHFVFVVIFWYLPAIYEWCKLLATNTFIINTRQKFWEKANFTLILHSNVALPVLHFK